MKHILITEDEASILAGILDSGGYSQQESAIFQHLRAKPVNIQRIADSLKPLQTSGLQALYGRLQKMIDNAGHTKH